MRDLPPRARLYVVVVAATALAIVSASVATYGQSWPALLFFAALSVLAAVTATSTGRDVTASVAFIVSLASICVLGREGAAIAGLTAALTTTRGRRIPPVKRIFNGSQHAICGYVAGSAYLVLGGPVGVAEVGEPWQVLAAGAAASLVYYVVNILLVGGVLSLTSGLSPWRVWAGVLSPTAVMVLGYGMLGFLLARLYGEMGPASALFFLAPLLVARSAFANYAQLREAYDATVRAFAQAVETKDYYTRGHSERVSRVTEMIAREWGMREDRVQVIRIAGMLHDVGKLGVPTRILQKQGKLNQVEFEAIKLHPLRGYEMLCEIDFLREALDGVYHHHERMDGRGYPMGLTDDEIPEFARIIMVADAFDSMTSTRSYRQAKSVDEAVAELRRCQGVQFDERVVDCLVRAVGKHGWDPNPEDFFGERVSRDGAPLDVEPATVVYAEPDA